MKRHRRGQANAWVINVNGGPSSGNDGWHIQTKPPGNTAWRMYYPPDYYTTRGRNSGRAYCLQRHRPGGEWYIRDVSMNLDKQTEIGPFGTRAQAMRVRKLLIDGVIKL